VRGRHRRPARPASPANARSDAALYRTGPRSHRARGAVAGAGIALAAETAGRPRSSTAAAAAASDDAEKLALLRVIGLQAMSG